MQTHECPMKQVNVPCEIEKLRSKIDFGFECEFRDLCSKKVQMKLKEKNKK